MTTKKIALSQLRMDPTMVINLLWLLSHKSPLPAYGAVVVGAGTGAGASAAAVVAAEGGR
jgi:predicted RNA methylase